jgi:hypothetical protein
MIPNASTILRDAKKELKQAEASSTTNGSTTNAANNHHKNIIGSANNTNTFPSSANPSKRRKLETHTKKTLDKKKKQSKITPTNGDNRDELRKSKGVEERASIERSYTSKKKKRKQVIATNKSTKIE